jgi:tetratricopeptide (TPR) repeat protein
VICPSDSHEITLSATVAIISPYRTSALVATLAIVVALALVPTGVAEAADDPAAVEAKKHYEEGTKAFNLGEYPRAIAEFKATYNAKPDPLLLYNIAQSYRLAGDANQALFFYKSFLRNMPAATNRKEVEGRIKALEKQVAEQKKDPGATAVASPVAPMVLAPAAAAVGAAPPPLPNSPTFAPATGTPGPGETEATAGTGASSSSSQGLPAATPPASTASAAELNLTAPQPGPEPSRPIYKKWWFWAGTAGAVLIIGGLAVANAKKGPNTALGIYDPSFK